MKIISNKSKNMWWIAIIIVSIAFIPNQIFAQEDTKSITLEIKSQLGDRLDTYQTVLKIYQDDIETPYRIIEFPDKNPILIDGLPVGHEYKIDIFVTGMFVETVNVQDQTEIIVLIPSQGGYTFSVFYEDGQTPIEGAKITIKSDDGHVWQQDIVGTDGKSKRFWMQSNNLVDNHYVAEITIDQGITYTSSEQIKFFPNIQDNIKIETPWPKVIDELITVTIYKNPTQKVSFSDGRFTVMLYDSVGNKVGESKVTDKGKASFSNLKVGQYWFDVVEESTNSEESGIIFPTINMFATGKETSVSIFGKIPSPNAENTCNCVAFRLDDVQDYYLNTQQIDVMNVFKEKNVPLTIGIIGGFWGQDTKILDYIKNDIDDENPIFEIANHSWDNNPLPTFSKSDQVNQIQKTNDVIQETLGVTPTTFTPVENKFNQDTIEALKETGFTQFTGHIDEIHTPPYLVKNSELFYLPANTETAELNETTWEWEKTDSQTTFTEAQEFIEKQGFAVVMMHPYEFAHKDFEGYTGETDFEQIENLKKLIDDFEKNGIEIVPIGEIPEKTIYKGDENTVAEEIESCDCVYFRFIALQDYWLNNIQIEIIKTFVDNELDLTVGIIGNVIGDDLKFVNYLKNTVSKNENIVIANNGWNYESLSEFTKEEQSSFLAQSNIELEKIYGETPKVLIPPYDLFNEDTILAMQENNLSHLSANVRNDPPPHDTNPKIQHFPGSAVTGIYDNEEKLTIGLNHQETFTQIQNSLTDNGFAVVTLSPPEFASVEDHIYLNEINESQIKELDLLLERIQNEGLEIRPMIERTIIETEKPTPIIIEEDDSDCDQTLGPFLNFNGCDFRHMIIQQINLGDSSLMQTNFSGLEIINVNFANSILSKADLTEITMSGGSFENAKLDAVNFSNAKLQEVNLRGADLTGGNLMNIEYSNSDAKEASFRNADLANAVFRGVGLSNTDFSNANLLESDLSGINLADAILKDVNFENAKLTGTSFLKAKLGGAILKGADLTNANFKDADLSGSDLSGATLDNITLSNAILVDAQLPGADLQKVVIKEADFSGANLRDVNLSGSDLSGSDLSGSDLSGATLDNITLSNAILVDAQLHGADLQNMNLKDVNLSGANLRDVNLSGSDLSGATLNGADLTNVNFEGTDFSGSDLSNTGLELKDLKNAITDDKTITSETGFFFFRELIAFFESLFK